jgi:hypothetical protein
MSDLSTEFTFTKLEGLQSVYSDVYKEAYGHRPRNINQDFWNDEAALAEAIDELNSIAERELEWERAEAKRDAERRAEALQVKPLGATLGDFFPKTITAALS